MAGSPSQVTGSIQSISLSFDTSLDYGLSTARYDATPQHCLQPDPVSTALFAILRADLLAFLGNTYQRSPWLAAKRLDPHSIARPGQSSLTIFELGPIAVP